ncbi:hypothetical protein BKA70DRAFT_1266501 [Coprinopsis sp. MPI-PUGE-AT-0042]|nr:hypothetical protein BKA70DRAFT_1266501 [Coprinopsis sp. MPI-PUGE-AT-0042]
MVLQQSARLNIKDSTNRAPNASGAQVDINPVMDHMGDPDIVDWMNLAAQLSPPVSQDFVTAIQALSALLSHNSVHVVNSSRKIIALIELAHRTLFSQGISIYGFTRCASSLVACKSSYTELIRTLHKHRAAFPSHLQDRVQHLVVPLHSTMYVLRAGDSSRSTGCRSLHTSKRLAASVPLSLSRPPVARRCLAQQQQQRTRSMPPPDAFPTGKRVYKSTDLLRRKEPKRLWSLREGWKLAQELENLALSNEMSKRRRKGHKAKSSLVTSGRTGFLGWQGSSEGSSSEPLSAEGSDAGGGDENATPVTGYRVIHTIPRRFGIFCTPGKSSMHGSFRVGPRPVRLSA